MSWPELPEMRVGLHYDEHKDVALRRIGWAILSINEREFQIAERHLAKATAALQEIQRQEGGHNDADRG